jgi:V8-like Glu-specific endopeptidase
MVLPFHRALFVAAIACSSFWAATAAAQDAPASQRISSGALREQVRRKPQGVAVPVEITKQGNRTVLQTADGAVRVANPDVIAQQVRQMPVQAVVSDAGGGSSAGAVRVQDMQLQASKKWNDRSAAWRTKYRRLDAAQQRLDRVAERALAPDASEADLRQLKQATDAAQQQVVAAYKTLPESDRSEQRALVEQHAELRRLEKSLYGRDDRYPPQTYERIYANSRGAFALRAKAEDKPRCSAVLIGEKLALTNNHCILEEAPDEFEAVFDYEDDLAGNRMPPKAFPVADIRLTDEDARGRLDFVLLELGANADGALPGAAYPVQCLSQAAVRRDEPLYVVGYPLGEPRTVHDNTFVYFPFRLSEDEYIELKLLVSAEFDSVEAENLSYREGKLKEFTDSYRLREDGDAPYYEYISVRFGEQPTIGVDSDTYRGNSGSPVYHRRSHAVVGLLFDGQEDLSQPWAPGWRSHEAVLPIAEIVERLDAAAPEWRSDPRVCVLPAA